MAMRVRISAGNVSAEAEFSESDCAKRIYQALPIESIAHTWGEEVYFAVAPDCKLADDAREDAVVGDVAYWPPGRMICIFFGRTPASGLDGAPRAAEKVNRIGRIVGDATALRSVREGEKVTLSPVP